VTSFLDDECVCNVVTMKLFISWRYTLNLNSPSSYVTSFMNYECVWRLYLQCDAMVYYVPNSLLHEVKLLQSQFSSHQCDVIYEQRVCLWRFYLQCDAVFGQIRWNVTKVATRTVDHCSRGRTRTRSWTNFGPERRWNERQNDDKKSHFQHF